MAIEGPCYKCKKRFLTCHDTCEDYKEYKDKLEEIRERKKKHDPYLQYRRNGINGQLRRKARNRR